MSKVRSDNISNRADDGAPALTYGVEIPVGVGITGAGGINITGIATATGVNVTGVVTATTFIGNVTGNATGLSGTPDITVNNVTAGVITATTYVGVPEGTNVLKAMLFV